MNNTVKYEYKSDWDIWQESARKESSLVEFINNYHISFVDWEENDLDMTYPIYNGEFNCMGFCFNILDCLTYESEVDNGVFAEAQRIVEEQDELGLPSLRIAENILDCDDDEYMVAFRISERDDDFHFIRQTEDGKWYEKCGCCGELREFKGDIEATWHSQFGDIEYDSDTVYFAVRR